MTTQPYSWQPIETAPKDRMILLYVPFEDMALGRNDWRARGHWNAVKLSIMELIGSGRCYFNSSFKPIQPTH